MTVDALSRSETQTPTSAVSIGVVVCDCGGEIGGRLDTEFIRRQAAALPNVVYTACEVYPCSKDGQARLQRAIVDRRLDRVLVAGCTPRMVERLFREAGRAAGLPGDCLDVIDIREQCAYIHGGAAAAQKAVDLIEMGVARLSAINAVRAHSGRVVKAILIVGSGLSGLTAALEVATSDINVTIVEPAGTLGGALPDLPDRARAMIAERIEAVSRHPRIRVLLNACVSDVSGRPGDYEVRIDCDRQATTFAFGAMVIALDAQAKRLDIDHWYDRTRVRTQAEFEAELETAERLAHSTGRDAAALLRVQGDSISDTLTPQNIVMILCGEAAGGDRCSRVCCLAGIRQAIRAKQANPDAHVTILFRDLYLGGEGDLHIDEVERATKLGVVFFRYRKDHPPRIGDKTIEVPDPATGEPLQVPFDCAVLSTPLELPDPAGRLAALLRLPRDERGFLVEPRVRLRPGRYVDAGVYVLGGAHQPVDTVEALFQAYVTGARVLRFLSQREICIDAPVAEVNPALCSGCAECVPVCPTAAIAMHRREGTLSLAALEALRCTGCGNCVVACPVKAIDLPGWNDAAIVAQIVAALRNREPSDSRVIAFACEWSAYASADLAGARRKSYPTGVRLIRMPCSARFDPNHVLWAFLNGADGVFLGACPPGECHYGAGNRYAQERIEALRQQLAERGFDPRRLRLELLPGDDGEKFAQAVTDFMHLVAHDA